MRNCVSELKAGTTTTIRNHHRIAVVKIDQRTGVRLVRRGFVTGATGA